MTGPPQARNASGRTSFSPARSCAAVQGTAMCLLTLISVGCSLDSPAKAPPFDPVTEGSTQLSPVRACATRGRTTRQGGWNYRPSFGASCRPVSTAPPPRIKPPKRSVAPPARQAAGPPEARPPRRCLQARLSHKSATTAVRCRFVQRPGAPPTVIQRAAEGSASLPPSSLEIFPTPSTYATASGESGSALSVRPTVSRCPSLWK
jgi:hypothetical protein